MGAQQERRALPDDVLAGLRAAFGEEVARRLPHLRHPTDLELARRDAHTLASSAWVVGERAISRLARSVEDQLVAAGSSPDLPALVAALEGFAA